MADRISDNDAVVSVERLLTKGFSEMSLEVGMVFAFEPKLVLPEIGAVGIESTFYFAENGLETVDLFKENY